MGNIVKYTNNGISLDARIEGGQAWLTYEQTAELFGIDESVVGKHARDISAEGELGPGAATARFAVVRTEGNRSISRDLVHVNQDMVLHIGYRVRSERGSEFRRWATMVMKGEAPPMQQPPTQPMTALEIIAASAQALVVHERRLLSAETRLEALEHKDAGMMTVVEYWAYRGTPFDLAVDEAYAIRAEYERRAKNIAKATRADVGRVNRQPTFELSVLRQLYEAVTKGPSDV